jgi:hypothetical protein
VFNANCTCAERFLDTGTLCLESRRPPRVVLDDDNLAPLAPVDQDLVELAIPLLAVHETVGEIEYTGCQAISPLLRSDFAQSTVGRTPNGDLTDSFVPATRERPE